MYYQNIKFSLCAVRNFSCFNPAKVCQKEVFFVLALIFELVLVIRMCQTSEYVSLLV